MDQQHQQPMHDDHSQNYVQQPAYPMYPSDEDPQYGIVYPPPQIPNYPIVQHPSAPPPRHHMSETDIQQAMQFQRSLTMIPQYPGPVYTSPTHPPHAHMPLSGSPPQSPTNLYDPLSPPISGSDTSADGIYHHHSRNSSATGSPSSSRANSLVHRHSHYTRYNPTPSPTSSSGRRSRGRSLSDDDDQMGVGVEFANSLANTRKEATRRQRIEAEQRRRDELRDGYARLKDVLPVSNQKSSKVSLLERATNHIVTLEKSNRQLQARLQALETEVQRLRSLNEKISLSVGSTGSPSPPSQMAFEPRTLSSPPEIHHQLTSIAGQQIPREDSSPDSGDES